MGRVVLISTYEMGRQPFGLASPAAWLRAAGADVTMQDLAVSHYDPEPVRAADLVAVHLPMHTATRLAGPVIARVRAENPDVHIACYGLYGPLNEDHLRSRGADTVLGAEFERDLVALYRSLIPDRVGDTPVADPAVRFIVPDRAGLPGPARYGRLELGSGDRSAGYTEATRGCRHSCRHCPVVPVYEGRFVVVPPDVVLEDVRRQVAAGAEHITFGDPDFFNGPAHARRVVTRLHDEFPDVTYDVTIKVEHLLARTGLLPVLADTGCALVTSAFEAFDDRVLELLDKGHTAADIPRAVSALADAGLALNATFVAFTPWTTRRSYLHFLHEVARLGLVDSVAPIQYAVRLLIVSGSRLLEIDGVGELIGDFDEAGLVYPWRHPDPALDELHRTVLEIVEGAGGRGDARAEVFGAVRDAAHRSLTGSPAPDLDPVRQRVTVPYFTEPWFC